MEAALPLKPGDYLVGDGFRIAELDRSGATVGVISVDIQPFIESIALLNGQIYAVGEDGYLYRVAAATGQPTEIAQVGTYGITNLTAFGGNLAMMYYQGGPITVVNTNGALVQTILLKGGPSRPAWFGLAGTDTYFYAADQNTGLIHSYLLNGTYVGVTFDSGASNARLSGLAYDASSQTLLAGQSGLGSGPSSIFRFGAQMPRTQTFSLAQTYGVQITTVPPAANSVDFIINSVLGSNRTTVTGEGCSPGVYALSFIHLSGAPGATCRIAIENQALALGERYAFGGWVDNPAAGATRTVVLPASGSVRYEPVIGVEARLITSANPPEGGTIVADPPSKDGFYPQGTSVKLTAVPSGSVFGSWADDLSGTTNPQTIVMSQGRAVTALFVPACQVSVSPAYVQTSVNPSIQVTAPSNCVWRAISTVPWLEVDNTAKTGSGTLNYAITTPNDSLNQRLGAIKIGNQVIPVADTRNAYPTIRFLTLSPAYGTGASQTFTFTYSLDSRGDTGRYYVLINEAMSAANACYVELNGSSIRLLDDTGRTWSSNLSNSQCSVNAAQTSVSGSVVRLSLTFQPGFTGKKNIWTIAYLNLALLNSGWKFAGVWWPNAPAGTTVPRYRLYDPYTQSHLFTTDANEYNVLPARGFSPEGASTRVFDSPRTLNGVAAVPYYRIFDTLTGLHSWTADAAKLIVPMTSLVENVDGFVLPTPAGNAIPLWKLQYAFAPNLYHWTTDRGEYEWIANLGWTPLGPDVYVFSADTVNPAGGISVVDAASYQAGPISPGERIAIAGSGLRADARVRIGGVDVQPVATSERSIEVVVPDLGLRTRVDVEVDDAVVECQVAAAHPRIVEQRRMYARSRHDRQRNAITVSVTGTGGMPMTAEIGGRPANVLAVRRGAAGMDQVDLAVPEGTPAGPASLAIRAGEFPSQPAVFIEVE